MPTKGRELHGNIPGLPRSLETTSKLRAGQLLFQISIGIRLLHRFALLNQSRNSRTGHFPASVW